MRHEPCCILADLRELHMPPVAQLWGYARQLIAWTQKPGVGEMVAESPLLANVCVALGSILMRRSSPI